MSHPPFFCCSIPDLAIQLLQRRTGGDGQKPLLVISADRPGGRVMECNAPARKLGVCRGMRYSEALSLSERICADVVSPGARREALGEISSLLQSFLPALEGWDLSDGVLWGDLRGMERLGGGSSLWMGRIRGALGDAGWSCGIAAGWTRAGTFLAAGRSWRENGGSDSAREYLFSDHAGEIRWLSMQPLDGLPLTDGDRRRLSLLGITRVSQVLSMPEETLKGRFSRSFGEVFHFLKSCGGEPPPGDVAPSREAFTVSRQYEPPLRSALTVLSALEELIEELLPDLRQQGEWVRSLSFSLHDDTGRVVHEDVDCGHLTREGDYLRRLTALRIENRRWAAREIPRIVLSFGTEDAAVRQGHLNGLFDNGVEPFRGVSSVEAERRIRETLALLQARLGDGNVFQLALRPGRVPERRFSRETIIDGNHLGGIQKPVDNGTVSSEGTAPLLRVRRVFLSGPRRFSAAVPPVRFGPYVQTPEWWNGDEADRVYTYHQERGGRTLWLYRTVHKGPWMVQGWLE
jgi:hypothetical protein